jgi:hypothetical protein
MGTMQRLARPIGMAITALLLTSRASVAQAPGCDSTATRIVVETPWVVRPATGDSAHSGAPRLVWGAIEAPTRQHLHDPVLLTLRLWNASATQSLAPQTLSIRGTTSGAADPRYRWTTPSLPPGASASVTFKVLQWREYEAQMYAGEWQGADMRPSPPFWTQVRTDLPGSDHGTEIQSCTPH